MKKLFQFGIAANVWLYRRTRGRVGSMGGRVLLLTTVGRKTGKIRTIPLVYLIVDDNPVVAASAAGSPRNPGWYFNLEANPEVTVEIGAEKETRRARITAGDERAALYRRFVDRDARFGRYEARTGRVIPVVVLEAA